MNYSQKYCLVSFLRPIEVGVEFKMADWPLHVTLADVFAVELTSELIKELASLLRTQQPVSTIAKREATLDEAKVTLLDKNSPLINLHIRLIDLLASHGALFNTPAQTKDGFLPHCTIQKAEKLHSGDRVTINTISFIDMFPKGNWRQRKVLYNFRMSA